MRTEWTAFEPAPALNEYITSYWIIRADPGWGQIRETLFPDGGATILLNGGPGQAFPDRDNLLCPGILYLLGPKTYTGNLFVDPGTTLMGVRLKPGVLPSFYDLPPADQVDRVRILADGDLLELMKRTIELSAAGATGAEKSIRQMDQYFVQRAKPQRTEAAAIIREIIQAEGKVAVGNLVRQFHVSIRTLQRAFKLTVGISPREFIKIVRFQQVLKKLQARGRRESLLHIAFEAGYYDHAHLSHEFKRYSGISPGDLKLLEEAPVANSQ